MSTQKVTVKKVTVKRAMTATTVEMRAREGLRIGTRLVFRSVIALLRGRRVRLVLRRPGASDAAVALATDIAMQSVPVARVAEDGGDERIRTAE